MLLGLGFAVLVNIHRPESHLVQPRPWKTGDEKEDWDYRLRPDFTAEKGEDVLSTTFLGHFRFSSRFYSRFPSRFLFLF